MAISAATLALARRYADGGAPLPPDLIAPPPGAPDFAGAPLMGDRPIVRRPPPVPRTMGKGSVQAEPPPPLGQHNIIPRALWALGEGIADSYSAMGRVPRSLDEAAEQFLAMLPGGGLLGSVRAPVRIANPIRAYHGSPHQFDEFDLSRIGTGEGAQAYGHGLYFAESEPVARSYRDALTTPPSHFAHGLTSDVDYEVSQAVRRLRQDDNSYTIRELRELVSDLAAVDKLPPYSTEAFDRLVASGHIVPPGHMYEVSLHARPEQFIAWGAPRASQSGYVLDRLSGPAGRVWDEIHMPGGRSWDADAARIFGEAGIPGIRYLDAGSRAAGTGTHNYVVFNPAIIEILRRYGIVGPVAGLGAVGAMAGYTPNSVMQQ